MRPQSIFVSATPGNWELDQTQGVFVEQVIRPTGLVDPAVEIRPVENQVDDLVDEARKVALAGYRTLVTTLTKKMAEDLTEYLHEQGIRVRYMHSDIDTIEPNRNPQGSPPWHLRCSCRHQPASGRTRHTGVRIGRDFRCRQGRLPAL